MSTNGASPWRGSRPESPATAGGHSGPVEAMPIPSPNSASVRCTIPARRSAMPEVAIEQLAGCTGMPTQQFSRRADLDGRPLPVLRGTVSVDAVEHADQRRGRGRRFASGSGRTAGSRGCCAGRSRSPAPSGSTVDRDLELRRRPRRRAAAPRRGCRGRCACPPAACGSSRASAPRCSRASRRRSGRTRPSRPPRRPSAARARRRAPRRSCRCSRRTSPPARGCAPGTCGSTSSMSLVVLLDLHAREDQRALLVDVARRRRSVVGSELPMSAMCALTSAVERCRPSSSITGTRMQWSPAWELPW